MDSYSPYLYTEKSRERLIAEDAYESFMYTLLGEAGYKKREQMRSMQKAISLVVDDIMRERFGYI